MEGLEVHLNSSTHLAELLYLDYLDQPSSFDHPRTNMMAYEDLQKSPLLHMLDMEAAEPNNPQYLRWLQQMKKPSTTEYSVVPAFELGSCITSNHTAMNKSFHQENRSDDLEEKMEHYPEKKKRKRARPRKNREDSETQRMTHIAVERNRRKQMNEYLISLRSLMPLSHVQRGDQASIVGGAIDFIKELEQLVHSLEAKKMQRQRGTGQHLFSKLNCFFNSSQYSINSSAADEDRSPAMPSVSLSDVEVTIVHGHVNLKVLSRRRPGQLLRTVTALEVLHLSILHLNVTSLEENVIYSFSLKIEESCKLVSADDIAAAVHHIFN